MGRKKQAAWLLGVFCCVASFALGCEEKADRATPVARHMSSAQLLRTPLGALAVTARKGGGMQMRLPEITQLHVLWRTPEGKERMVQIHRDGKQWWAVVHRGTDEAWGYPLTGRPVSRILKALRHLKPVEQEEFVPEQTRIQLSLFAGRKRFLMRIMQAPFDTGPTAIHHGEWLVYHHGALYQQRAKGPLGRSVPRLAGMLKQLYRRRDGVLLPMHSAGMDFRQARALAKELHAQRLSLRRCFKKRQFPASVGPLRMEVTFLPTGKVKGMRILTRPHTQYKVVWCVWWFAKKFKIAPLSLPSLTYRLVVPPGGP